MAKEISIEKSIVTPDDGINLPEYIFIHKTEH
jgi:hypothetical protein